MLALEGILSLQHLFEEFDLYVHIIRELENQNDVYYH